MTRKDIIIPKDSAVFWLDKNGCWHNQHGKFQHKKIIDYFHASIRKDAGGYYLSQTIEDYTEKVYFHYEDAALFVFDVVQNDPIMLVLNTGKKIKLKPENLLMKADSLYMQVGNDRIKFAERGLLKIAAFIKQVGSGYFINVKNRKYKIQQVE